MLDRTRNALTRDLVKYLFPIQPCVRREVPVDPKEEDIAARLSGDVEVDPNLESRLVGGSGNFDMMDAMADAMSTSYVHGKWVTTSQSSAVTFQPVLPPSTASSDSNDQVWVTDEAKMFLLAFVSKFSPTLHCCRKFHFKCNSGKLT